MTNARRLQIESVCAAALAVEGAQREAVLAAQCGADVELRREVESLLAAASGAEGLFAVPAWQEAAAELADGASEWSDAAPAVLLQAGTCLGPYEIAAPIGAGGMGEVHRARDTRLGRSVAVKVLPCARAADADRRRRFHHEARAASALHHPNICAIYDVGDAVPTGPGSKEPVAGTPSVTFLVMELLEGETLAERLARGRLPLAQALEIAAQLAAALGTAHKAGIVHRDVRPGNVMLTKPSAVNSGGVHATLLDFGLAKLRAHGERPLVDAVSTAESGSAPVTARGMILGTLPYMAPEQVEGKEADARTDIWALGAVIYEMVAGARAFVAATPASLIAAILEREPEPLTARQPLTPPSLYRVVRKCLAKDPDGRWDSAHDVADELRWIAQDCSSGRRDTQPSRTRAKHVWIGSAVTVGVVAIGLLAWWRLVPPPIPEVRPVQITAGSGWEGEAALAPDGSLVAYAAEDIDGNVDLWVSDVRGGRPSHLRPTRHGMRLRPGSRTAAVSHSHRIAEASGTSGPCPSSEVSRCASSRTVRPRRSRPTRLAWPSCDETTAGSSASWSFLWTVSATFAY